MASNQGRVLDGVLEDVAVEDLQKATVALRREMGSHPVGSSCDCPTLEALSVLYELGYRVVKSPRNGVMASPRRDGEMWLYTGLAGVVAHYLPVGSNFVSSPSVCGAKPHRQSSWYGWNLNKERDKARDMDECKRCLRKLNRL